MRTIGRRTRIALLVAGAFAAGVALTDPALAQVSTATLKGRITSAGAAAQSGLAVTAVNKANGNTYRTTTLADGSYALVGLAPGAYEVRVAAAGGSGTTEIITLQVGQTASLDLALGEGASLDKVTVLGSAQRADVKTSEIGTNVSTKMIETLPQQTRNFLSAADLAPGVRFEQDNSGNTKIQGGAQNNDHINVFIDGVSQKNNVLKGGLTGQDSSRGNPFPQSAIAEYKVLTQNYKAEYDQVSSAAITAVTKSGTNEFHGGVYVDRTGTNWRNKTPFEKRDANNGIPLPSSSKYEYGLNLGGPIQLDKIHYFLAYDGKKIGDSRTVGKPANVIVPNAGVGTDINASFGSSVDTFREHLLFAKVDAQLTDEQKLTGSFKVRREKDRVPESRDRSAPSNEKDRTNNETHIDLKHEFARGVVLNEARLGYENSVWNPHSSSTDPLVRYKFSPSTPQVLTGSQDILFVGGSPDAQRRQQKGPYISEDFTYTGVAQHVMKTGLKFKAARYDLSGTALSVPTIDTIVDRTTGAVFYSGLQCLGTNIINNGLQSDQCTIRLAAAGSRAAFGNNQIGLYFQDDWALTRRLELNLGLRWDYETNMLNNDYVTPADRLAAIFGPDTRTFIGQTAAPGQTYAQSLAKGGIDINEYVADGHSRKPFAGAFSPRVGFSYDVRGDKDTVFFGGFGRSYDRTMANNALDELQKNENKNPGAEIWMIKNDVKMPYADQWSLGLRQAVGEWNAEVSLARIYARNQFVWFVGNRDLNGGAYFQSPIDPLFGGPNGFGTLILGDFVGQTRTNQLFVKVDKPYTTASAWTATVAYTYSDAQTTHREWNNDIFDFTYSKPGQSGWKPSTLVDKHRIVGAGAFDLPFGFTLGAKATWASGFPHRGIACPGGFPDPATGKQGSCVTQETDGASFRQIDLSLIKAFKFGAQSFTTRIDIFNIFNTKNYNGYDDFIGVTPPSGSRANAQGGDNLGWGTPNSIRGDPRTVRLMLGYNW